MLSEEWELFKIHVSEIRVKQIRVNQGLGVLISVADYCLKFET